MGINASEVYFPKTSETESCVYLVSGLSVNCYLTARAYLDEFLNYDIENGNIEEYEVLLENTVVSFEAAERLSNALIGLSGIYTDEETMGKPEYKELTAMGNESINTPLSLTACAKTESEAVKWARDITERFDKAPAGRGIRTLAEQLNTDAKHAYAQLKQAQDILQGAEYSNIADKANTAYQTAVALKATGTAAGFVIAVSAAPATTTLGAVINTGGTVMSGISTVLDIGEAGSILYTNGEGNYVTEACSKTSSQMAPIGQIFSTAAVFSNISNIYTNGKEIIAKGGNLITDKSTAEFTEDVFNVISYGAGAYNSYSNDGSILGGTFTHTKEGLEFTLMDTLCGTEKENTVAAETILKEMGIDDKTIRETMNKKDNAFEAVINEIPDEVSDKILGNNGVSELELTDVKNEIFIETGDDGSITIDAPNGSYYYDGEGNIYRDGELLENNEIQLMSENNRTNNSADKEKSGISGEYEMTVVNGEGLQDSFPAKVNLNSDGTMEISFTPHALNYSDGSGFSIDSSSFTGYEHLVGIYDKNTKTFTGQGDIQSGEHTGGGFSIPATTYWNMVPTVITFDDNGNATGVMGADLTGLEAAMTTQITMIRK